MPTFTGPAAKMVEEYLKATGQTANEMTQRPVTPNWRMAEGMNEKEFTRQVIELARLHGWRTAHFRPAWTGEGEKRRMITAVAGDGKGFLDLTLLRERLIVAELKVGKNQLTPEQKDWILAWQRAGVPAFVWRPEDWAEILSIVATPCPLPSPPPT